MKLGKGCADKQSHLKKDTNMTSNKKFGVVKFFVDNKGYGFIVPADGSKDIFFHIKNVVGGKPGQPQKDDHVSYVLIEGKRGAEAGDVAVVA